MAQPQTIARPYAKAVFGLAENDADQQSWRQFLNAAAELAKTPKVMQHMHAPEFAVLIEQWLNEWLDQSRKQGVTDQEHNFLRLLETHDRFEVLPEIAEAFNELCASGHNSCIAHVKSAKALDDQAQKVLIEMLERKLGKSVTLEIEEAPELMAGVVIEYDGQVINQSLQGRLQQFARKLDD